MNESCFAISQEVEEVEMGDEGMIAAIQDFGIQLSEAAAKVDKKPKLQYFQACLHLLETCLFSDNLVVQFIISHMSVLYL